MADYIHMHPRTLIRHAVVRVLAANERVASCMGGRVYPNRAEHWLADELPACGVYTLSEDIMESDRSPDPNERRISLVCELVARMTDTVDDALDALTLVIEEALNLDAIGEAMGEIVDMARAEKGLPPLSPVLRDGVLRHPADTLLLLGLTGTDIGIAVTGNREVGVAAMSYDLEYELPAPEIPLSDFLYAISGWDVAPHDGHIDMVSRVELEPVQPGDATTGGMPEDALEQIDNALKE